MYTMIPFNRTLLNRPNSLFDDRFFRSFFNMNDCLAGQGFRVDIRENENDYVLEAELPGLRRDAIDLSVENNTLTVSADYNSEKKDERNYYSERRTGHVQRSFSLDGIREDAIRASYRDGILYVTLPKAQPDKPAGARKIAIEGANASGSDTEAEPTQA